MIEKGIMEINLGQALCSVPWWYYTIAGIFTFYHGWRGYVIQEWSENRQKQEAELEYLKVKLEYLKAGKENDLKFYWMKDCKTKCSRYWYDALFYIFSSIIGFLSLWFGIYIFNKLGNNFQTISGGASAIIVFLFVLAILGAGGKLPHVINRGNKWY